MSIANLTKDASALEKLNMEMYDQYTQEDKELIIEEADKESFSKKDFLSEEVKATLESREDLMKKADSIFGNDERDSPFKTSKKSYNSSSSSSFSRGYSSSGYRGYDGYGRYGRSSSSKRERMEEKISRITSKAQEISEEKMANSEYLRNSRRNKRNKINRIVEKIVPRNSKRRKALIFGGFMVAESVLLSLLLLQDEAKDSIFKEEDEK